MTNTIKMKRGNETADICNLPECIENAKNDGWVEVKEEPKKEGTTVQKKTTTKKK